MPTLHVLADVLRWAQGTVAYTHAYARAFVELELSQEEWDALKVQMLETEAMIEFGLMEK